MANLIPKSSTIISDSVIENAREIDFLYPSDSLIIHGLLIAPLELKPKNPLLVFNHGGINGIYPGLRFISRELAHDNGFVVFASSYRGEDGSDGEVEIAKGEVDDVLNGLRLIAESDFIDRDKVFMVGSSHGALITLIAMAKDTKRLIKKGVYGYGISDIFAWTKYLKEKGMLDDDRVGFDSYPFGIDDLDEVHLRNGVEYIDKIKVPLLIVQGEDDDLVPPEQALILKDAADKAGIKDVSIAMIPHGVHGLLTKTEMHEGSPRRKSPECEQAWKIILEFLPAD
jgi:dipeptidyl aminopeptidase/acylaminoacyl peptidase